MNKNTITPTDALYGFSAWLTTRDEVITLSAKHDACTVIGLILEFIRANNLTEDTSLNYPQNLIFPRCNERLSKGDTR